MKRILLAAAAVALSSCSPSPKDLGTSHLDLIKSGKVSQANQQYCMKGEILRLHSIKSFQPVESQPKNRDEFSYVEVTAKIDTDQDRFKKVTTDGVETLKKEILQQATLEIWNSDDFYQELIKTTAKLNDLSRSSSALTGSVFKAMPSPDRSKVSAEKLCVFLPYEQFESDELK